MGCDYFASEDGKLTIAFRDKRGVKIAGVDLTGLDPEEKIYRELLDGRVR